jgi:hypothetical protein
MNHRLINSPDQPARVLSYESPPPKRTARQRAKDIALNMIDVLGGVRGFLLLMGINALLIGPHHRGWIGMMLVVLGTLAIEAVVVITYFHR